MSTTLHMRISCCMGLGPEQQHNKCLTASTATTYSSALLEKVFLHSSLGPPLRADPLTLLKTLLRQACYYLPFRAARDLTSYAWCTACSLERREN